MRVGAAWCVELQRVVDGVQAKAAYFAQAEPRKRFTFLCSNEHCRSEHSPRVIGVNYDKLFTDEHRPASPHFRAHPDDRHSERCPWVLRDQAARRHRSGGPARVVSLNALRRFTPEKDVHLVDVFEPATGRERELTDALWHVPQRAPERADLDTFVERLRTQPVRTHRLQDIVNCYLELGAVDRLRATVRVADGPPMAYTRFFQPLSRFSEVHDRMVYFGGARVHRVEHGFALYFYDRVQVAGERREVSLFVSDVRLSDAEGGAVLRQLLSACTGPGSYAKVYFFGEIGPSSRRQHAASVRLTDLENLVVVPAHVRMQKEAQPA